MSSYLDEAASLLAGAEVDILVFSCSARTGHRTLVIFYTPVLPEGS